ncbi:hypothetical protein D3C81_1787850 [compost metagenome]
MTQFDTIALVIAPQRQHDIRHHHHQRGTLCQLLVQTEQHSEHRNGDQATANSEQATHGAECGP